MSYLKRYGKYILCLCVLLLSYNLYFIFLIDSPQIDLLIYLDFLVVLFLLFFIGIDSFVMLNVKKKWMLICKPMILLGAKLKD